MNSDDLVPYNYTKKQIDVHIYELLINLVSRDPLLMILKYMNEIDGYFIGYLSENGFTKTKPKYAEKISSLCCDNNFIYRGYDEFINAFVYKHDLYTYENIAKTSFYNKIRVTIKFISLKEKNYFQRKIDTNYFKSKNDEELDLKSIDILRYHNN